jgi:hypothetical protein
LNIQLGYFAHPSGMALFIGKDYAEGSFRSRKRIAVASISEKEHLIRETAIKFRKSDDDPVSIRRADDKVEP